MKRMMLATTLLTASLVLSPGTAWLPASRGEEQVAGAPNLRNQNQIKTSGTATVKVRPDAARLVFGVTATGRGAHDVRAKVSRSARKIMDAMTALKLTGMQVQTSELTIEPVPPEEREARERKVSSGPVFKANHQFQVLLRNGDPKKLSAAVGRLLDAVLDAGSTFFDPIDFLRTDADQVRREALTKATAEARANAEALARGIGVTIKEVVQITDEMSPGALEESIPGMRAATPAASSARPPSVAVVIGEIEVSCRVRITCAY